MANGIWHDMPTAPVRPREPVEMDGCDGCSKMFKLHPLYIWYMIYVWFVLYMFNIIFIFIFMIIIIIIDILYIIYELDSGFWSYLILDLYLQTTKTVLISEKCWSAGWADQFRDTPKWYHFRVSCRTFQGSLNQADLFAYMQVVAWCLIPPAMTHELGDTTGFFIGVHDASRTWIGVSFVLQETIQ